MRILITGSAGNLGSLLARHLLGSEHQVRLMYHQTPLLPELASAANMSPCKADLAQPETLIEACRDVDCIVHFAGVLFAPRPDRFLPTTNVQYVKNLVAAAKAEGVGRFILISFPHVEGESTPDAPATGNRGGSPTSVHARTRLEAEEVLLSACDGTDMVPVVLRAGMIYARGVLMIDAARWLARRHLLHVWRRPTWIHLISLPDFLTCTMAAATRPGVEGIYNLGDDQPITLQEFLDSAAAQWQAARPLRLPNWCIWTAAWCCEAWATIFRTKSPLTRDFISIGMASYWSDTTRMKAELLPELAHPTLGQGLDLL